ncbi:MAG: signal peptidase I [Nitrospira sp.]|nr:signal peptidase I [Nitrospira sp.]
MFLRNSSPHKQTLSCPEQAELNPISTETAALYEEILNSGLSLRIRATGRSMAPFLNGGEILTIKKGPDSSFHIGDLIFFKTRYGSLLLHRIIRKQYKDMVIFQTKGDAVPGADEPVSENDILGKVCIIEKNFFGMRTKRVYMESRFWKTINYLLAIISSLQSRMYLAFTYLAVRR